MTINLKRGPPSTKAIPKCLVINARSLAKPDAPSAFYTEMISTNIDICFVSETWLHSNISSKLICPNGYGILMPQGTVLGPFLFSLLVNDIKSVDGDNNLLVKFADDITVSAPVKNGNDTVLR